MLGVVYNLDWLFVCVEAFWPGQPNGVMLSAVSFIQLHFYWAGLVL